MAKAVNPWDMHDMLGLRLCPLMLTLRFIQGNYLSSMNYCQQNPKLYVPLNILVGVDQCEFNTFKTSPNFPLWTFD